MLRITPQRRFFKSYSHLPLSNPLRRWVHIKFAFLLFTGIVSAPLISYVWTARTSPSVNPPDCFAAYSIQLMMEMAPLNLVSRTIGDVASWEFIPRPVHAQAIRILAYVYGIDMSQYPPLESYRTSQDFFCRKFKHGGSRPLERRKTMTNSDSSSGSNNQGAGEQESEEESALYSPCDAEILQCGEVAPDRTILQVKGFSYPVDGLFRMSLPPMPTPGAGLTRLFFVFHLRPGDYHRVHSPQKMRVSKTLHVPGMLLPTTETAMRWIPNLIMSNERVLLFGEQDDATTTVKKQNKVMAMALVGATCVGSIHLAFDERIVTNVADAPETSVLREYGRAAPVIDAGEEVGHFKWGSCVVLIADVPTKAAASMTVKPGSEVLQGQRLI